MGRRLIEVSTPRNSKSSEWNRRIYPHCAEENDGHMLKASIRGIQYSPWEVRGGCHAATALQTL